MSNMRAIAISMNKPLGSSAILLGAITLLFPLSGMGQDFFRDLGTSRSSGGIGPVVPSDYTYEAVSSSSLPPLRPCQEMTTSDQVEQSEKYNFTARPPRFTIA